MLLLRPVIRVLEGGINMQNRNTLLYPLLVRISPFSLRYSLAYERRDMAGLESWRYTSSSGSCRLPRSWIMLRIVSAVRLSRTFASSP